MIMYVLLTWLIKADYVNSQETLSRETFLSNVKTRKGLLAQPVSTLLCCVCLVYKKSSMG